MGTYMLEIQVIQEAGLGYIRTYRAPDDASAENLTPDDKLGLASPGPRLSF